MAGYHPGEYPAERKEWEKRIRPDDFTSTKALLNMIRKGVDTSYRSEYRYRSKKGEWLWILSQGKVITWTEGKKPARFIGTHTNISKQKHAEEKQRQSEKTYRNIFLNAQIGLFRVRHFRPQASGVQRCYSQNAGIQGSSPVPGRFFCTSRLYLEKVIAKHMGENSNVTVRLKMMLSQFYRQDGRHCMVSVIGKSI